MAKKKKGTQQIVPDAVAPVVDQPITETIEKNYMPYAMSVIISRAIPEIDGFKPSHRKILYTMFKMGLLTGPRTKSANVVGQTMHLNPHGDASIYETLVRLTRGNESLLHPFVDSKGSFGKQYSSDMAYAASRYTEVKLDPICNEIFRGIDKNAVDFIPNYDNTTTEPVLLPTSFPNILVSPNMGIAVGMMSKICSFNLAEVCDGTIQILRNPHTDVDQLLDIIKAPDFPGGGLLIYNRKQLADIYATGVGSVTLRARYTYDKESNCIDILQIPYSTTLEIIMKKLVELVKNGTLKEITDFRDEIDLSGFKLTLDLRRGVDPDQLMNKLFKLTALQDNFSCNFNVLIGNVPKQLGILDIIKEWIKFRMTCVQRELGYDVQKKKDRLHLLQGLGKILLDIDKAIRIIRQTPNEKDVVPNLMKGFGIDEIQAEFVAEIKLRYLNREYILKRTDEIQALTDEIADLEDLISSEARLKTYIAKQLREIKAKYGKPRMTQLIYEEDLVEYVEEETVNNFPVRLVFTREGYFKKIPIQSIRPGDEHNLKENDEILIEEDAENTDDLIIFSDRGQCYKASVDQFDMSKAAARGDYVPAKLGFDQGEKAIYMKSFHGEEDKGNFVFLFENGKGVRVPVSAYSTKSNRRKLTGAYSDLSPVVAVVYENKATDLLILSDAGRAILISSDLIPIKTTRTSQGVTVFSLKDNQKIVKVVPNYQQASEGKSCRKLKIPATGVVFGSMEIGDNQTKLF
ncbi:MAG: DNA gyrase subunit A [Eubacteriales bacterium]